MRQKLRSTVQTGLFSLLNSFPQLVSIPKDNDCGEQIEASYTVVLGLGGSVTDFALTSDTQSVFQSMMRLAFVQANLGASLHVSIKQPVNDEERALDAADFPKGYSQFMGSGQNLVVKRPALRRLAFRQEQRPE